MAEAYASWDFHGRPGSEDLAGLVLIDGSELTGEQSGTRLPTVKQARASVAEFRAAPREDIFGLGTPYAFGVLSGLGDLLARDRPQEASPLLAEPLFPRLLVPRFTPTNQTILGLSYQLLAPAPGAAAAHAGHPAPVGDPRRWIDGDITPIARLADWLSQTPIDTVSWDTPRRLLYDVAAADRLTPSPVTRLLGLRVQHRAGIRLPVFAFATGSFPSVRLGQIAFGHKTHTHLTQITDDRMTHFDPLTALPSHNTFLSRVARFLRRLTHHHQHAIVNLTRQHHQPTQMRCHQGRIS